MKNIRKQHVLLWGIFLCIVSSIGAQNPGPAQEAKGQVPSIKPITLSKSELIKAGKLSSIYFENNNSNYRFTKYLVSFFGKGRNPELDIVSYNDSFPPHVFECIRSSSAGVEVYFDFIRAIMADSEDKTWHKLPSLKVTLTGE